jgi:hypothetical protein
MTDLDVLVPAESASTCAEILRSLVRSRFAAVGAERALDGFLWLSS